MPNLLAPYRNYLKSLLLHKKYVAQAMKMLELPKSRAVLHDWTKFFPDEFFAYAHAFYEADGSKKKHTANDSGTLRMDGVMTAFALAWRKHQTRNPHHWQYWCVINDEDGIVPLPMPETYIREMIADWWGAGKAYTGKGDAYGWYKRNGHKMILAPETRSTLELFLDVFKEVESEY